MGFERRALHDLARASALLAAVLLTTLATAREQVEIVPLLTHAGAIVSGAFSSDGARVVTGGKDGTAKLWDAATGRLLRTFEGHAGEMAAVAFSTDGRRILTGGRVTKLWNAATGQEITAIETGTIRYASEVALSPDGSLLLSAGELDGAARLWDVASGRLIRTFQHAGPKQGDSEPDAKSIVNAVAFSPDGSRVLTGGDGDKIAKMWEVATGRLLQTFGDGPHREWVALAFSPDGARVLTAGNSREPLKLWDAETGKLVRSFDSSVRDLAGFSRDGSIVIGQTAYEGLRFWNADSGQQLGSKRGASPFVAISADGVRGLEKDLGDGGFTIENLRTGQFVALVEPHVVNRVAESADGERIVSEIRNARGDRGAVVQWEAHTGTVASTRMLQGDTAGIPTSDGAHVIAMARREEPITLRDTQTGKLTQTFEGSTGMSSVTLSPAGGRLLACCNAKAFVLWDAVKGGQPLRRFEAPDSTAVALSRDGNRFAMGNDKEIVKVWDTATGRLLRRIDPWWWHLEGLFRFPNRTARKITTVAFSPDGRQVLTGREWWSWESEGTTIKLWDVATGALVRSFDGDRADSFHVNSHVTSLVFSPDGTRFLSTHDGDAFGKTARETTLRLWETATGKLVRASPAERVRSVAFSHDGRFFLCGEDNGAITIRNTQSGELVATLISLFGQVVGVWTDQDLAAWKKHHDEEPKDEWLVVTPEGFFEASSQLTATRMLSIVRGLEIFDIGRSYEVLHRPDLVRAKLAGDPEGKVKAAAAGLEAALQLN